MSGPPPGGWQDPSVPPNSGQPYRQQFDPTGYGAQQPPPPNWQQGGWPQQPSPPPNKGNSLKWLLITVAVLLVIGITIGATLIFTRGDGGGGSTPTSGAASEFASAGDTGPVAVITDEPTCNTFNGINNGLADIQNNGWGSERQTLGPQAEWTAEQRSQVQAVAIAMENSAKQMVALAQQTPHRVIRELYEQFSSYARAYSDSIPNYVPADDDLATTSVGISATIFGICSAVQSGATSRAIAIGPADPPTNTETTADSDQIKRFIVKADQNCSNWIQNSDDFDSNTTEWQKQDTGTPASAWTPERRAMQLNALPFLTSWADQMQAIGKASNNPTFEDFAFTASLYMRAYASVGDKYVGPDSWLSYVGYKLNQTVLAACRAAGNSR